MVLFLGALAAAAVGVVSGGIWRLVVALVAVAVVVLAAWYALSRRSPARLLGVVGVVAGVGGLIAVAVTAEYHGLPVALALVGASMSAAAARFALGPVRETVAGAAPVTGSGTDPAVLILNPRSGGGKAERFELADRCRDRGIRPVVLRPGDDLQRLAEEAIERGARIIGMAGGDGSQALVASVAAARGVPYVCIPAGTRNHLALDLGIDRDDVVGALDAYTAGVERTVDLAEVNGRVFVNNVSMGLYARIVSSPDYRDAKLKTASSMLPDLLGPEAQPFDLRFTLPDGTVWPSAHMLLVSNNPYELDRLAGSGRRPRLDSGRLGMVAARLDGPADVMQFVTLEAAGQLRSFRGWVEWTALSFRVDSAAPIDVGIDGEATTLDPPLLFTLRPGALRVRLPPSARYPVPGTAIDLGERPRLVSIVRVASGRPTQQA